MAGMRRPDADAEFLPGEAEAESHDEKGRVVCVPSRRPSGDDRMKDPPKKAKEALQTWAKVIAMHVRNQMEAFHCRHLSDAQMKELNPIIRTAIYGTLRQLYFLRKGTKKQRLVAIQGIHHLFLLLPDYWEAPDLTGDERADEEELAGLDMTRRTALFGSERAGKAFVAFVQQHLDVFG
jgi:hypothetical protein